VEQWWPEISKADVVDSKRSISSNIFADVWLVDRLCEDLFLTCVTDWCVRGRFRPSDRRQKNRDGFEYGENVDAESMMAVIKRTTRIPRSMRVLIATPPLDFFAV
jgi:hypothetical protein